MIDIDLEAGLSGNEGECLMIVGADNTGQTQESVDSNRINSFNRLYYDGLQQIISRQRAVNSQEATRGEIEASQMQDVPVISLVSDAVAKAMPQRPKKADQFQLYSTEWKKIRDAKVEQQRANKQQLDRIQSTPKINPSSKYLPQNYKGPVRGYYEQVGKYFEKKQKDKERGEHVEEATPRINRGVSKDRSKERDAGESVEARLLRKGEEYKTKRVQLRH